MELTENYDIKDPFIHEKLFYVDNKVDALKLSISFQMQGESGMLEIADSESNQAIWSDTYSGNIDNTSFDVTLENIEKEKEYVIRFTGTKIIYAKIQITSEDNLIKERERPLKPDKD